MSRRFTGPEKNRRRGGRLVGKSPGRPGGTAAPTAEDPATRARRLAREAIFDLLKQSRRGFKSRSLYNLVGRPLPYPEFRTMLGELLDAGTLRRDELRRWCWSRGLARNTGTLTISPSGFGHVHPDDGSPRVFIPRNGLGRYLQDDRVEIEIHPSRRGPGPEGRIVKLLERRMTHVIGTLVRYSRNWLLIPESARFGGNITVTGEVPPEAEDGKVVRAELLPGTDGRSGALIARITRVLGDPGTPHVMQESVKAGFNLRTSFPPPVLEEADLMSLRMIDEAPDREDLRERVVFTIDPPDARDFDDAVSIIPLEDGGWELAVHIADVSHFVPQDSALDREAYRRGCSVYLVGEVVPMLPHRLSSDLCSLVEGEDRLCFSAFMRFSSHGAMKHARFAETRIRSAKRFSYQDAQEIIESFPKRRPAGFTPESAFPEEPVRQSMCHMDRLWRILKRNRLKKGGLDFSIPEPVFQLDEQGKPLSVQAKVSREANFMIEEFMLAANRAVAEGLAAHGRLCVHRVHEAPSGDKLDRFIAFLEHLGPMEIPSLDTVAGWQQIVKSCEGTDKSLLLQEVVLRSMMKARYDVQALGHFGLGFQHYAHFTSPIRRYPDL
ncbi:MAG: RNB domain-containing ribonuclease, partial [Candidatus Cloacimonetes bacterium]|nr:RNB domain-containing ribonuclease [Candidatus Cloacimonadota bacterium]